MNGKKEFVLYVGVCLVVILFLLMAIPNGTIIAKSSLSFLLSLIVITKTITFVAVILLIPAAFGLIFADMFLDYIDMFYEYDELTSTQRFILNLLLSVILMLLWGWLVPAMLRFDPYLTQVFQHLNLSTRWEIFPWGWAFYSFIVFWIFLLGKKFLELDF